MLLGSLCVTGWSTALVMQVNPHCRLFEPTDKLLLSLFIRRLDFHGSLELVDGAFITDVSSSLRLRVVIQRWSTRLGFDGGVELVVSLDEL